MSKKALGKGIGALFQEVDRKDSVQEGQAGVFMVRISAVKPNPLQPRTVFNQDALEELADSIRENGVIQPLLAEKQADGSYQLIAGERRLRASQLAGLTEVPVLLKNYSEEEKLEIALIENVQREDLSPIEEAKGYEKLMSLIQLSQNEIAKKVGKKRSTIANALRLLKLPYEMQEALHLGNMTPGHARAILSVLSSPQQEYLYKKILAQGLSVREAESLATALNQGKVAAQPGKGLKTASALDPDLRNIEQKLIDCLGTKVKIQGSSQKGKIEVSYFSLEDLERIMELLGLK